MSLEPIILMMYVRMDGWMDGRMDGWIDKHIRRLDARL